MIKFWGDAMEGGPCPFKEQLCQSGRCHVWRWFDEKRIYGYCGAGGEPKVAVKEPLKEQHKGHIIPYDGR